MSDLPVFVTRAFWLFGVPVTCALTPWFYGGTVIVTDAKPLNALALTVLGLLPITGLLGVLGYKLLGSTPVRLWPYLPYAAACLVFMLPTTISSVSDDALEQYVFAMVYAFILLPLLAIAGSFVGFIAIGTRAGGLRA
jgi:hypothetical protein